MLPALKVALPFGTGTPEEKRVSTAKRSARWPSNRCQLATLDGLDGLVLAGGNDVDPALYGEHAAPDGGSDPDCATRRESALLREAIERDLPVLAICRGLQLLNVARGGTLLQHVKGHSLRRCATPTRWKSPPAAAWRPSWARAITQ